MSSIRWINLMLCLKLAGKSCIHCLKAHIQLQSLHSWWPTARSFSPVQSNKTSAYAKSFGAVKFTNLECSGSKSRISNILQISEFAGQADKLSASATLEPVEQTWTIKGRVKPLFLWINGNNLDTSETNDKWRSRRWTEKMSVGTSLIAIHILYRLNIQFKIIFWLTTQLKFLNFPSHC